MKKFLNFVKKHPVSFLMWVVSVIMLFFEAESALCLAAVSTTATLENGTMGSTPVAPGQTGAETQLPGQATTVTNVAETSDLIEAEIDEQIVQIASDESVIDNIKRKVKRKLPVNSFEVDHYLVDEKPANLTVKTEVTGGKERVEIEFNEGNNYVDTYYTISVLGVKGYNNTEQSQEDLMLQCVGKSTTSGNPIFKAVNGKKDSESSAVATVPAIPAGTKVVLCASAAYETQKFIAASTVVPKPERLYLQKQLCNRIVSDYFNAQKKRIPFNDSVIAEAILRQFRLESCRTAWIGVKGKTKVKAMTEALGEQFSYTSKGLRWQFKRSYPLVGDADGKLSFDEFIDLAQAKFTTYNSSKVATFILGKDLLAAIQKVDMTKHKDITIADSSAWGIKCTKLVTVFGTMNLVHDPTLDRIGCSWQGGLIDDDGLVRYYMKNEDNKTEEVEGEEAKREIVMTIDCLCLKGYSHMWVDGSALNPNA